MSEGTKKDSISKPPVIRDEGTALFFDGAAQGKLMLQYCKNCGEYSLSGGKYCPCCLGPVEWVEADGCGTLFSWAVVHQLFHPAFAQDIPYVVAAVELHEGPVIYSRLLDVQADALRLGLPVRAAFLSEEDSEPLLVFRPA